MSWNPDVAKRPRIIPDPLRPGLVWAGCQSPVPLLAECPQNPEAKLKDTEIPDGSAEGRQTDCPPLWTATLPRAEKVANAMDACVVDLGLKGFRSDGRS